MEFEKLQGIIAEVLNMMRMRLTMSSTFVVRFRRHFWMYSRSLWEFEEEFDIEIPNDAAESIVSCRPCGRTDQKCTELSKQ